MPSRDLDDLVLDERMQVLERLRSRGRPDAPTAGAAQAVVSVEVTGGAPGERYLYRVDVRGDGRAEHELVDELRDREVSGVGAEVDAELVRRVFGAVDEAGLLEETAPEGGGLGARQIVPDSLVMVLTVEEDGVARRVVLPVEEPGDAGAVLPGEAAETPLETPVRIPAEAAVRLRPVLDALHEVEDALPR